MNLFIYLFIYLFESDMFFIKECDVPRDLSFYPWIMESGHRIILFAILRLRTLLRHQSARI